MQDPNMLTGRDARILPYNRIPDTGGTYASGGIYGGQAVNPGGISRNDPHMRTTAINEGRAAEIPFASWPQPPSTQTPWQNPQQTGLGSLMGNNNLHNRLFELANKKNQGPPRGYPFNIQGGPEPRPFAPQHGFNQFGEQLGGFEETLGGYGEQMGGFGETLGGYGEQISGFEEQLGGFGEQFGGMEKTLGGFDKSITDITDRLSGIEEGIASLKTADNQHSNPYSRMYNPFSFLGYWGGRR